MIFIYSAITATGSGGFESVPRGFSYMILEFLSAASNTSIVAGLIIIAVAPSLNTLFPVSGWSSDVITRTGTRIKRGSRRKYFRITEKGKATYAANKSNWEYAKRVLYTLI